MLKLIDIFGAVSFLLLFLLSYAKIFKSGDIQNTSLIRDKELKILIYETPSYVMIYRSYILLTRSFAIAKRTARRSCLVDLVHCQHCFLRHMG